MLSADWYTLDGRLDKVCMLKMGHFSLVVARTHNDTMMSDMDKARQGAYNASVWQICLHRFFVL